MGKPSFPPELPPRVLVCIGSVPCRLSLTAVPMMEGVQLIVGKYWLDIMNPLVNWRSNTVYLWNGSQLEPIQGIREKSGTHCQIIDKGLNGLQHYFRDLKQGERTSTTDLVGKVATLRSPTFWRYEPSTKEWVSVSSSKKAAIPQGGGTQSSTVSPDQTKRPRLPRKSHGCKHTMTRKVAGKYVR